MKLCPKCGRFGIELHWSGLYICLWRDCTYQSTDYVKPYSTKIKFPKFVKYLKEKHELSIQSKQKSS